MSRELIKGYRANVADKEDAVVIDTNALIEKKIEELQRKASGNGAFVQGLSDEIVDEIDADRVSALLDDTEGGFTEGSIIKAAPVYNGPSPEELIAQAEQEIEAMKSAAREEIDMLREEVRYQAYEQGKADGYEEGKRLGASEYEKAKQELEAQAEELALEFTRKQRELEPQFVEMMSDIYSHVLGVSLADNEKVIMTLIENVMNGIDSCRNFMIHVSEENYEKVSSKKKELGEMTGLSDVVIDVINDKSLPAGGCMIETENGIFDCSLGTELNELSKELRILSYRDVQMRL